VTRAKTLTAAAVALLVLAGTAMAYTPPQAPDINIPNLPNQEVERFKVTLNGSQGSTFSFAVDMPDAGCSVHGEGRVTEDWKFARGKGVVLEFRRIKGTRTVFLQRRGHPPGDVSFATPGTVLRTASGFWDELGPAPCSGHHEFSVADCDRKIRAPADMFFIWTRSGKLTMEPTSKSIQKKNPAAACGSGNDNIDGLSWEYPFLAKQKGKLTAKQVFGKKKHIVVPLDAGHPIMPLRQGSFIVEKEQFGGDSRLVLSRLP
jgi:hypothetical protein